jgi:aminoglycoside 2'-N-acetyltransferase I
MAELERMIRSAYDVGALGATVEGASRYAARGWRQWQGALWVLSPSGPQRTESEDGEVYVLDVGAVELDVHEKLTCDWREGHV